MLLGIEIGDPLKLWAYEYLWAAVITLYEMIHMLLFASDIS